MRPEIRFFFYLPVFLCALFICGAQQSFLASASTSGTTPSQSTETKVSNLTSQLRWGRMHSKNESANIVFALNQLFERNSQKINFAKRGIDSLLEEAIPREIGRLFPFRRAHKIPANFFFENFGSKGFLVGELEPRVPPILSGTDTADWLELRGSEPVSTAREFTPPLPLSQGLRGLGVQNPWLAELFTATWTQPFETASAIVEYGSLKCWNKSFPKHPYPALAEPASHVRCAVPLKNLTPEASLPKQLPKKIGNPSAVAAAESATAINPPAPPACMAMGRLKSQSLEILGDEKAGHCLLWRNSLDERFLQKGMSSKLICLNARHKSFQKTRFNSVVAVLPSLRADSIHVLESEDGLINSYRLNLATLSISKEDIRVPSGQNLRNAAFLRQKTGLYACQQSLPMAAPLFPTADQLAANTDWIYIDDAIYSGLRLSRNETDVAWRLRESGDATLEVERLSWSQLQYDHPSITNERAFSCIASRELDAKCGLRVLQSSMQLSEEWLNGEFDKNEIPPSVQLATALLIGQSLERLMTALPGWSLHSETQELLAVYAQKVKQILENKSLGRSGGAFARNVKDFPMLQRYLDLPVDSPDYLAIKKQLSSSADFWALLKQKSL